MLYLSNLQAFDRRAANAEMTAAITKASWLSSLWMSKQDRQNVLTVTLIDARGCAGTGTAFLALFSLLVFCGPSGMVPFRGGGTGNLQQYAALPAGDGALARHGRVLTSFEPTDRTHDAAVALVQGQFKRLDHRCQLARQCHSTLSPISRSDRQRVLLAMVLLLDLCIPSGSPASRGTL